MCWRFCLLLVTAVLANDDEIVEFFQQGGRLDSPLEHGFTLEMRKQLVKLGVRFRYETEEEFVARMDLGRRTSCLGGTTLRRARAPNCDQSRLQAIDQKRYQDSLILFSPLSALQIQVVIK